MLLDCYVLFDNQFSLEYKMIHIPLPRSIIESIILYFIVRINYFAMLHVGFPQISGHLRMACAFYLSNLFNKASI